MTRSFTLKITDEGDGFLWAHVEELPGCFASGQSMDELLAAAAEAIGFYLSDGSVEVACEPPSMAEVLDHQAKVHSLAARRDHTSAPAYHLTSAELLIEA